MRDDSPTPPSLASSLLLPAAVVCLAVALVALLSNVEGAEGAGRALTAIAGALTLARVAMARDSLRRALLHRSTVYSLNSYVQVGLALAILGMVNYIAWSYSERVPWMPKWDMTEEGLHTFSKQTEQVLARLARRKKPVEVKAFFLDPRGSTQREQQLRYQRLQVQDLLSRYAQRSDGFVYDLIDPERDPLAAREHGIQVNGTILLKTDEVRIELTAGDLWTGNPQMGKPLKFLGEQVITSKLLDILEGVERKLYFTTGHREGDLDDDQRAGFSKFRAALERDNYTVQKVNLLVLPAVPEDCSVLVILGPKLGFAASEIETIRAYLRAGRPALIAMDSQPLNTSLAELLGDLGLQIQENILIENDAERHLPGRPTFAFPFLNGHHITNPLIESGAGVALDEVLGLEHDHGAKGYDLRTILQSSGYSWGETNISDGQVRVQEDEKDIKNPVSLALAISSKYGSNDGLEKRPEDELRVVLIGDSDLASNGLLEIQGNKDFLLNSLGWLTRDEERVTIRPRTVSERRATLPEKAANRVMWGLVAALPALVLALGFALWLQRRQA